MTAPVLVIAHEENSPPGLFARWLEARELPFAVTAFGEIPADPAEWRAIVSLGWEETAASDRPEVLSELALLQAAITAEIPVLGLCFGSQILARALGGTVAPRHPGEFGWVRPAGPEDSPITAMPWFCWHDDAFELPGDAGILASTDLCTQAYRVGQNVGFQFHPEVDEATIDAWLAQRAAGDHPPVDFAAVRKEITALLPGLEARAFALFDWWAAEVGLAASASASAAERSKA
ncbi:MAG: type 1 glutamine amidotransferase [Solirubrobacteraceae bacterium]|nr:type 1 glutamine amidotransferase [Solirubrobacteraceae bacterium]